MKKISKILSIILAISMVISMLPMSFAADPGYTIVYDFIDNYAEDVPYKQDENNFFTYKGINEVDTYKKSNGFWKFDKMEGSLSVNHRYDGGGTTYKNGLIAYTGSANKWYSINIRVPVSGSYIMSVYYQTHSTYDNDVRIYALAGTVSEEDVASTVSNGTGKVGAFDASKNASSEWNVRQNATVGTVELDAGENTLVFYSPNGKNFVVTTIELSSDNGSLVVPMSVTASADKTSLDATTADDSAQISVSSVMYSDTTTKTSDISATDFVYTSSDTSLATVDASGKVTVASTAVPGKVDINIAAKENLGYVLGTVSFDVVATKTTNTKIVYDFVDNYTEDDLYTTDNTQFFRRDSNLVDTYEKSNGFWKFAFLYDNLVITHRYTDANAYMSGLLAGTQYVSEPSWYAIKLRVPVSDIYKIALQYRQHDSYETDCRVYLLAGDAQYADVKSAIETDSGKVGTFSGKAGQWDVLQTANIGEKNLSAGEYLVAFYSPNRKDFSIQNLSLTAGNGTNIIPMSAEISANDVEAGKETAIALEKAHMSDATVAATATGITYESSDNNILTVSGTNATGVKAGTAKIYAKYNGETIGEAEVTVSNATVEKSVTIAVDHEGTGENITVDSTSYKLGDTVEITAKTAPEGKVFRGWVRGSADNGRLVETSETYNFIAMTNIYLTAVYTDAPTGEVSEYYNWNGEFLGTTEPTDANAPTLLGYVFAKTWKDAGKVGSISRKIAEFNKENTSYEITTDDTFTMVKSDDLYDTEVTCTADNNVYWYRGEKLVDYGKNYTFFIWDATKVTTSNEGNNGAKIILDKEKNGSWMIEYDAGTVGKDNILEVGIVFGDTGSMPTVEVCEEKMSSQRDDFTHGQFTATSDYPVARGYVTYKDGNEYKVIYAD